LTIYDVSGDSKTALTHIYYFSGTGNSFWSAKQTASLLEDECRLFSIGIETQKTPPAAPGIRVITANAVVFIFPSYALGLPVAVRRFIKSSEIKASYTAALVCFGSYQGGALAEAARLLGRKKIKLDYAGLIPAVENFIPIFGPPDEETMRRRLALQKIATEQCALAIKRRESGTIKTFKPFSKAVSLMFHLGRRFMWRWFKISNACTGCGICARVCPAGAINMGNGRPQYSGKCQQCQACVNFCPQKAITFGRARAGNGRYTHPEVPAEDFYSQG
jgi:ferredoxin